MVWLLTWLDGELLLGRTASPDALGRTLGALNAALATFEHPAAHRTFAWDLASIAELEDLLPLVPSDVGGRRAPRRSRPDRAAEPGHPRRLPPGNLLVSGEELVGVLDFGDVLHTARVVDLAIALNYLPARASGTRSPPGSSRVVPLTAEEREALLPLHPRPDGAAHPARRQRRAGPRRRAAAASASLADKLETL